MKSRKNGISIPLVRGALAVLTVLFMVSGASGQEPGEGAHPNAVAAGENSAKIQDRLSTTAETPVESAATPSNTDSAAQSAATPGSAQEDATGSTAESPSKPTETMDLPKGPEATHSESEAGVAKDPSASEKNKDVPAAKETAIEKVADVLKKINRAIDPLALLVKAGDKIMDRDVIVFPDEAGRVVPVSENRGQDRQGAPSSLEMERAKWEIDHDPYLKKKVEEKTGHLPDGPAKDKAVSELVDDHEMRQAAFKSEERRNEKWEQDWDERMKFDSDSW